MKTTLKTILLFAISVIFLSTIISCNSSSSTTTDLPTTITDGKYNIELTEKEPGETETRKRTLTAHLTNKNGDISLDIDAGEKNGGGKVTGKLIDGQFEITHTDRSNSNFSITHFIGKITGPNTIEGTFKVTKNNRKSDNKIRTLVSGTFKLFPRKK